MDETAPELARKTAEIIELECVRTPCRSPSRRKWRGASFVALRAPQHAREPAAALRSEFLPRGAVLDGRRDVPYRAPGDGAGGEARIEQEIV